MPLRGGVRRIRACSLKESVAKDTRRTNDTSEGNWRPNAHLSASDSIVANPGLKAAPAARIAY